MTNFNVSNRYDLQDIIDTTDGSVIYTGYSALGTKENEYGWSIKKTVISGSIIKSYFPRSSGLQDNDFNYKWTDRLTITYI